MLDKYYTNAIQILQKPIQKKYNGTNLDKDCHCSSQTPILHKYYANPTQIQLHIYKYKDTKAAAVLRKYYAYTNTETPTQNTRTCTAFHNL